MEVAPTSKIETWNASQWGFAGKAQVCVDAFVEYKGQLYTGGKINLPIEDMRPPGIARWDGKNWLGVGMGTDNLVLSLCVFNDLLYAGGTFTKVGNTDALYIASWDGSRWDKVGSGMNNFVMALCEYKNELYAGGSFTSVEGNASYIAKWTVKKGKKKTHQQTAAGGF